ncbi:PREDICTED: NAC domain-containing protein 21/22-like [Nelumbo nucifera]|uniref:NAC domain-containing protein 21/22-like n=1 Tax=Nelumbo nucifera TaxID=4432 RepID=A0A1U8AJQ6_NELNU|nr:PREDICTED: NAC domain-containing protein 21/22-like [Nelumbo nucifera]
MGLRDIEATLPPGFRFYPSDEELVCHYLYGKIAKGVVSKGTMVDVDLHICEPWQLPATSGYWKATGKDRPVFDPASRAIVGMRKTLVFYRNRAPNGIKTGWIMHEFRLENPHMPPKEDWVLCRVFYKGKGEHLTEPGLGNHEPETTIGAPSPTFAPFSHNHTVPSGYRQVVDSFSSVLHHQDQSFLNLAKQNPNFLGCPQEMNNTPMIEIDSRGGDEFGFLLDMSLEENMGDGGTPSMEEMKFDDDDNTMVFI